MKHKLTYNSYLAMLARCYCPTAKAFPAYGAKHISVCKEWLGQHGYSRFEQDLGKRPPRKTLDRIDNSKGYFKENCRWSTRKIQSVNQNKRKDNKSGFFGVYWDKKSKRWRGTIKNDKKTKYLGSFKDVKDAARAYDKAARALHGKEAKQNFR